MKPVHNAQVSFHILHIFAQVLYLTHFLRLNVFSKGLLQNINKFQQAEKKINNERRKEKKWMAVSMKSMLNIPHGSSLRDIHTLYKGVEKVLTSHRIFRHAFAFQARKCVKNKKKQIPVLALVHNFADWN